MKPIAIDLRCEYQPHPLGLGVRRPRLSWKLAGTDRGLRQTAYHLQVSEDESFQNLIWDSGEVLSDDSHLISWQGPDLMSRQQGCWRVRVCGGQHGWSDWSESSGFEIGLLEPSDWSARWMTSPAEPSSLQICPLFRKSFTLSGHVVKARLYTSARGLYLAWLDGQPVTDTQFMPGWTSYQHRLQYQTFDLTDQLSDGEHVLGLMLGEGWYKGTIGFAGHDGIYGRQTACLAQLELTYADGLTERIVSGGDWRTAAGPVRYSGIYKGEYYDGQYEQPGWTQPRAVLNPTDWQPVQLADDQSLDRLTAQEHWPVRVTESISPRQILTTPSGEQIIDMGQNMVGWLRFHLGGAPGTKIRVEHAEVLDRNGEFYTGNLRTADQVCEYHLTETTPRWYHPHFSWQGFRYVRISGWPGELNTDQLRGDVLHTDMPRSGFFECSDPQINQLQKNIVWGQRGNFLDIPTDCPQRDERLGWTGDAQMFIRTACFNYDTALFFSKWLRDLAADQSRERGVPFVVPNVLDDDQNFGQSYSSAAWGDAAVICPWTIYQCYGDRGILEQQFKSMKDWVEYIHAQGEQPWLWNTGFHFGDWLALDAPADGYVGATATDLIATAFYAYSCRLLAEAAAVLGRSESAQYSQWHEQIVHAFREEFITPSGRVAVPTQTAHVLVLAFDLALPTHRQRIAADLVQMIHKAGDSLTTGFVGTPYICHALSRFGHHDLSAKLLLRRDYPSWLYAVDHGATTIWEHWDSIRPDGSFWSDDMNSFNHYAYGAIGDWLYRVVCGLETDSSRPGYRHSLIHPRPISALTFAEARLETGYGLLACRWETHETTLRTDVKIPPNTTAQLTLDLQDPGDARHVMIDGQLLTGLCALPGEMTEDWLLDWQLEGCQLRLTLGSGSCRIEQPWNTGDDNHDNQ